MSDIRFVYALRQEPSNDHIPFMMIGVYVDATETALEHARSYVSERLDVWYEHEHPGTVAFTAEMEDTNDVLPLVIVTKFDYYMSLHDHYVTDMRVNNMMNMAHRLLRTGAN